MCVFEILRVGVVVVVVGQDCRLQPVANGTCSDTVKNLRKTICRIRLQIH